MIPEFRTVAAVVPRIKPADVAGNVAAMAAAANALPPDTAVAVFPELCVTGATCGDLFLQPELLRRAADGIRAFLRETAANPALLVFGAPVRGGGRVFNAAVVAQGGAVLGVVPKSHPAPREMRWFSPASAAPAMLSLDGRTVPFGADLVFAAPEADGFRIAVEIGTDRLALPPVACALAASGATVICNPAAEPALADEAPDTATALAAHSRLLGAACVRANAGVGESSSSGAYPGDALVTVDGEIVASGARFAAHPEPVLVSVDAAALAFRRSGGAFASRCADAAPARDVPFRAVDCQTLATRPSRLPFVPEDAALREARCREVFAIQSAALATRLRNTGIRHVVLGLSGGLDSTLALLVCHEAFRQADLDPVAGIHLVTMPGFGTGARTRSNADALAEALGLQLEAIPVAEACALHLRDIGHDGTTPDAAYENCQARERTQVLMDRANMLGGLVIGTGDLSEEALGWCTFGGDQLSMYAVNADVPKTLVRAVVAWYAGRDPAHPVAAVLRDILATPISPELLPADANGDIAQKTEDIVGPYELHDFFLWHVLHDGTTPDALQTLAEAAFGGEFDAGTIDHWRRVFLRRFLSQQFKRTASPEGPAALSISLDPRDGWQMPGDVSSSAWVG